MGSPAQNLEDAIDLADLAEAMVRARLRRESPGIDATELERQVVAWLRDRPGAPHGDAEGRVVDRLRAKS